MLFSYSISIIIIPVVLQLGTIIISNSIGCLIGFFLLTANPAFDDPFRSTRTIPPQPWYMQYVILELSAGLLIFGTIFIEYYFALSSACYRIVSFPYFPSTIIVYVILLTCVILIDWTMTFFMLRGENHRWHWRSFTIAASGVIYFVFYGIFYYVTKTQFQFYMAYFIYLSAAAYLFALVTGAIGHLSTFIFVKLIYGILQQRVQ